MKSLYPIDKRTCRRFEDDLKTFLFDTKWEHFNEIHRNSDTTKLYCCPHAESRQHMLQIRFRNLFSFCRRAKEMLSVI